MTALVERCRDVAPNALFLQMSSPLGLNVAIARRVFGPRAFGVCELPATTASAISRELSASGFDGLPRGRCLGLNHQSWLYDFRDTSGVDVTRDVVRAVDTSQLLSIEPQIVRDLGAIPMTYMQLYFHTDRVLEFQRRRARSRGEELQAWAQKLDAAYCAGDAPDAEAVCALLAERRMNWFDEGVVPVLEASVQSEARTLPLNLDAGTSVPGVPHDAIVETDCEISSHGIDAIPAPPLPPGPWDMTRQLVAFERAALSLPPTPSTHELAETLELHPLTRECDLKRVASELAAIQPLEYEPLG
jgi:6-phospho-beta-glucosidase